MPITTPTAVARVAVSVASPGSVPRIAFAMPKSRTFTCPSAVAITLARAVLTFLMWPAGQNSAHLSVNQAVWHLRGSENGSSFRSRWTMPFSCAAASASARAVAISRNRSTGNPPFRQHAIERLPLDELHREEVNFFLLAGRRLRPRLLDGVDGDDAGVIEGGEGLGLALESREAFGLRRCSGRP